MGLTAQQLEDRLSGIGGTDAGVILGLSKWKSRWTLWREKRRLIPIADEETDAMEWGTILEPEIAKHYAKKTGRKVRRIKTLVHKLYGWMRCNIDREIIGDPRGPGVLEIKTVNAFAAKQWTSGGVPDVYYAQIQHNMAVRGAKWGAFAILIGGQQPVYFDVARDDVFLEKLIEEEAKFWALVQSGEEPPMDGSEATRQALTEQYPADSGLSVILDEQALDTVRELEKAKAAVKFAEEEVTRLENVLKAKMGEATIGVIEGWGKITWRKNSDSLKREIDWDRFKAGYPGAYAELVKEDTRIGARVFKLVPDKVAPVTKKEKQATLVSITEFGQAMQEAAASRAINFDL